MRVSVPVADIAAGHYASTAILAALSNRLITGQGETNFIWVACADCTGLMIEGAFAT